MMKLPKNWDIDRIKKVIAHYENQTENEAFEEDGRFFKLENAVVAQSQHVKKQKKSEARG